MPALVLAVFLLAGTAGAAGWSRISAVLVPSSPASAAPPDTVSTPSPLAPLVVAEKKAPAGKGPASTERPAPSASHPTFAKDVAPLVNKYCIRCHSTLKAKGGVALDRDKDDGAVQKNRALWERVADNLRSGEMPPAGARRPSAGEMEVLNAWLDGALKVDCNLPRSPGRVTARRLNRAEYNNTVRDLVGATFQPANDFPADDVGYGFDNIGDVLSLPPLLMEKYLDAAEQIIEKAFQAPELRRRIMARPPREKGALRENLRQFITRAYRRPVAEAELDRYLRLHKSVRDKGESPEVALKTALQAVLVSAHFLFRIEQDPPAGSDARALNDFELASRLSYFLWSSMPDEELFKHCRNKTLRRPGVLEAQVRRMLTDRKARALADNFAGQWLQTRNLASFNPDPKRFPTWNAPLRNAMVMETELFFLHVVQEDRSVLDFINADYTFVNERLARHYGLTGVTGENFRKVALTGTARGGVLTHASVLAVTSNPTRTSPVKRGKWILDNILGTPPPPPPPDVEELEEKGELKGTLRQRMEQHRVNPSCASCHQRMDPLGFGFENFDAIGAWRAREGRHPIDASGVLPGGAKFNGPVELKAVLARKKDLFAKCLTEKLLTYALGRGVERSDHCFVEEIAGNLAKGDHKFSRLVLEIVKSDPFQKRARGGKK